MWQMNDGYVQLLLVTKSDDLHLKQVGDSTAESDMANRVRTDGDSNKDNLRA